MSDTLIRQAATVAGPGGQPHRSRMTPADRRNFGRGLRDSVPRSAHAGWHAASGRADPLDILRAADAGRQPGLLPLRYGRMLRSPFTFYRGSAGVMAADLARTPATGIRVQACGDAHLMNFGGFATPERRLIFDINDLDETLPAPWEWDIKRLVASVVLAARSNHLSDHDGRSAAIACAARYRHAMRQFTEMDVLDVWYARMDDEDFLDLLPKEQKAALARRIARTASRGASELVFPKLVDMSGGEPRIRDQPPTLFHPDPASAAGNLALLREAMPRYRETLSDDRRVLLDRYRLVDAAVKVSGIGSVGTLCMVLLLMSDSDTPLVLQMKEAGASVLESFAGASAYPHHGQRVVAGQRLVQPASDLFLGWVTGPDDRQFYVRQLRDRKVSAPVDDYDAQTLIDYGRACGWVLARAHAKAGDPWAIGYYLGKQDEFDEAMGRWAIAYADQAEQDHAVLKAAVRAGAIEASPDQ